MIILAFKQKCGSSFFCLSPTSDCLIASIYMSNSSLAAAATNGLMWDLQQGSVALCMSGILPKTLTSHLLSSLYSFLRSECISTPQGLVMNLTPRTWLPYVSSPSTPSLTPGSSSFSPPACSTFAGALSAGVAWEPSGLPRVNHRWLKTIPLLT